MTQVQEQIHETTQTQLLPRTSDLKDYVAKLIFVTILVFWMARKIQPTRLIRSGGVAE